MYYFEYEVIGVPFLFEWADFQLTQKDDIGIGRDFSGWILDDGDYTELVNAINEVAESVSDELALLNSRINNLLYDPIPDTSAMDGRRLYIHQFVEVLSTDQVDGLEQRLAFFTNALSEKLSNIFASELTGITIDKSDPINPVIIANKPLWTEVREKPDDYNPTPHTHTKAEITDLGESGGGASSWDELTGKPTVFPPSAHGHDWNDINGKPTSFTPILHGHDWDEVTGKPTSFPPEVHSHSQSNIIGLLDTIANLQDQIDTLSGGGSTSEAIKAFAGWFADHWIIRSGLVDNNWYSVCWSPEREIFVAVAASGTGNRVMTSPDGITWTIRTSAADNGWYSVCWSPKRGIFVAVSYNGTGNRVMTSPDGITWTIRTSAADNNWYSVCWSEENEIFVAVAASGTGNRVMTSPDGITWTSQVSAADNSWYSVCWSPKRGIFVAVSSDGTGNRVMTSPDGITWTIRTSAADNSWKSVCWSEEKEIFVAVSISGIGNRVMTSPDGITWTSRITPNVGNSWQSVCYGPKLGIFVAVSISGSDKVMTSPDGINWTQRATPTDGSSWYSVCWSPKLGTFVAVCHIGNKVMTTRTGLGAGHL
ncbi:hypothetical protein AB3N60_17000 [Leptospira sp. WS39.C2]